jgi:hypothetical protein
MKKTTAVADPNGSDIHNQNPLHVAAPVIRVSSSIRCTKYVNDRGTVSCVWSFIHGMMIMAPDSTKIYLRQCAGTWHNW